MKRIYLVRHGESVANVEKRHGGPETPLTELGLQQAVFIAERVAAFPIQKIIASSMVRAQQTAQAISQTLDLPIETSDLFVETRGPSELNNTEYMDPRALEAFKMLDDNYGKEGFRLSDAEVFEDHTKRAQAALQLLAEQEAEHIAVVTHGLFLRILMAHVLLGPKPTGQEVQKIMWGMETQNTGLSILDYAKPGHVGEMREHPWQIFVWNDHAHLG